MRKRYPGQRKQANLAPGLSVVYSPVNQAWFVLWCGQVLKICATKKDAITYADTLKP